MRENSKIERPVIFSGPMVQAILDGRKTQTRRVVKPQPRSVQGELKTGGVWLFDWRLNVACPYGKPGDRLWVRETAYRFGETGEVFYRADMMSSFGDKVHNWTIWKPSIHMRRISARIFLEITQIRVERVQEISEEDAIAEGAEYLVQNGLADSAILKYAPANYHRAGFAMLWDSINGKREGCAWKDNPWVWAISFKRIENQAYPQIQASKAEAGK